MPDLPMNVIPQLYEPPNVRIIEAATLRLLRKTDRFLYSVRRSAKADINTVGSLAAPNLGHQKTSLSCT
jgi:hypothetical protein